MKYSTLLLMMLIISCHHKMPADHQPSAVEPPTAIKQDTTQITEDSARVGPISAQAEPNKLPENRVDGEGEADAGFQEEANRKRTLLLDYFGKSMPDYFSGAYIGSEGNLVVLIKGDMKTGKAKISRLIAIENVAFVPATFSLTTLEKIMDYLNDFALIPANKEKMKNISGWALMEDGNYIEICLLELNEKREQEFRRNILDSPALHFKQCGRLEYQ